MCPSYQVTMEEEHTTRGRARLFFEMVEGDVVRDGWRSDEVKQALELCLSCKGCKAECPVNVDMATYKAEFLAHHYRGRLRPRQAYSLGLIHRWAPLGALVPRLANFVTQQPGLRAVAKWAAGMAQARAIPPFAHTTFRRHFQRSKNGRAGRGRRVILWPDTFNDHFLPETLQAAVDVLAGAHGEVVLPPKRLCCGRPLYDYGMLDLAKKLWTDVLDALEPDIEQGTPLVGIEPSCVAAFRDELPSLMAHDPRAGKLAKQTHLLEEYLMNEVQGYEPPRLRGRAIVQDHCQGAAVMGTASQEKLLRQMGLDFEVLDSGCCGMAGSFGYEAGKKHEVSVACAERVLLPAVRGLDQDALVIADGFSCREQIGQLTDRDALHVAQVLQMAERRRTHADDRKAGRLGVHHDLRG
ncbi:MAG: (Fe-S)-binding protein [Myxococcota bacterium]